MNIIYLPPKVYDFEKYKKIEPKDYTRILSEHLANLTYERLPKDVVDKAKKCILDFLGYSSVAIYEEAIKKQVKLVKSFGGREESTIMGFGYKTSCLNAALVNANMGRICELDLTHRFTMSHTGDVIIPAAIAVAEREKADGKKLITAVVAGYEASLRIGDSVFGARGLYAKGWIAESTHGVFGAAAAVGKILDLDADKMVRALRFAGNSCHGITAPEHYQTPIQFYQASPIFEHCGTAAMLGILSALLSDAGFIAAPRVLEGEIGFWKMFPDLYDPEQLIEGLAKKFKIVEVGHKVQSCCRYIHSAIEATLELVQKHSINKDNIHKITVRTYKYNAWVNDNPEPDVYGSRFSIQFQVALAVAEGKDGFKKILEDPITYTREKLNDPVIQNLMKRIEVVYNKDLDQKWPLMWFNTVEIKMKRGTKYVKSIGYPRGEPENPMTTQELHEKFITETARLVGKEKAEKLIEEVNMLDKMENVQELTEYFAFARK